MSRPASGAPAVFVAQLPVNVLTQAPVGLRLDDADPGLTAPFVRCIPAGCFAEFELKDDLLKKFRAAEGVGKLTFKDAAGHDLVVPVSMKGFRAAYDSLPKE
jgi:invasion protein IalB